MSCNKLPTAFTNKLTLPEALAQTQGVVNECVDKLNLIDEAELLSTKQEVLGIIDEFSTNEQERVSAESLRLQNETLRATNETTRIGSETARATAENGRATAETGRNAAETSRATSESNREAAESNRVTAENGRGISESARVTAESSRVTAESARANAESSRVSVESARVIAESNRATAESERVAAETARNAHVSYVENNSPVGFMNGKRIALFGDSSISAFTGSDLFLDDCFKDSIINNQAVGGAKWVDVYTQLHNYAYTPDMIIVLAGSNDLTAALSAVSVGSLLGAPDVKNHTYDISNYPTNMPTQSFPAIKACLAYIRKTWPRCQVYCLIRADHPNIARDPWVYFKFYEMQIMAEWGVPVIDLQHVLNYTNFITEQNWALLGDNLHYTQEMNERIQRKVAAIIKSGMPCCGPIEVPSVFYCNTGLTSGVTLNAENSAKYANWVFNHCMFRSHGGIAVSLSGCATEEPSTSFRFSGVGSNASENRFFTYFSNVAYYCGASSSVDSTINYTKAITMV